MRYDLPGPDAVEAMASTTIGLACKVDRIDGIAIVVYTEKGFRDGPSGPIAWRISSPRWRSGRMYADCGSWRPSALRATRGDYEDAEARPSPRSSSARRSSPCRCRRATKAPGATSRGRSGRERTSRPSAPRDRRCGRGAPGRTRERRGHRRPFTGATGPASARGSSSHWMTSPSVRRRLTWDPETLDAFSSAVLLWCLRRPRCEMSRCSNGPETSTRASCALVAQVRWEAGDEYPTELGARFCGEGPRPDPGRLHRARNLVRRIAAAAATRCPTGAFGRGRVARWALGGSTHAGWYAERPSRSTPSTACRRS